MSKINAIRLINLNYNYNGIRIDDETFNLGGDSSLLSLRNGGGKSVLVQMMIAPFVHKRYRDSKDRPFASYFTTNKPTFILIEWKLDGNSGYVLTGMMVRKSQEIREDDSNSDLDIIQFIHEYKSPNDYDINNIPLINISEDNKKLKNYGECKSMLESIKLDRNYKFFLYDMNNRSSSRNYYDKLEEFQIYHKEWESIVKKVNIKESGLSELFTNAKDEAGLIEGWFLPAVEDKLNKGKSRIDEFQNILGKYIKQYKENKSKIDQKDTILLFKDETRVVLEAAERLKIALASKGQIENTIANLIIKLKELKNLTESEKVDLEVKVDLINRTILQIQYEELSFEIYLLQDEKIRFDDELSRVNEIINKYKDNIFNLTKKKNIQGCAKIYKFYKDASMDVQEQENKLELKKEKDKDRAPERESLGYTLKIHYENQKNTIEGQINKIEEEIKINKIKIQDLTHKLDKVEGEEKEEIGNLSEVKTKIKDYDESERKFNRIYHEKLTRNILDEYSDGSLELKLKDLNQSVEQMGLELIRFKNTLRDNAEKLQGFGRQIQEKGNDNATISEEIKGIEGKIADFDSEIEVRKTILKYIGFSEEKLFSSVEVLDSLQVKKDEITTIIKANERELESLSENYNRLKSGRVLELPKNFKEALDSEGIHYVYGMEWLKRNNKTTEENKMLVENNPFIPYGLIMTESVLENLKSKNLSIYTSFPIPIIKREALEYGFEGEKSSIHIGNKVNFYVLFNDHLLNEDELKKMLLVINEDISKIKTSVERRKDELKEYDNKYNVIKFQKVTEKDYRNIQKELSNKQKQKEGFESELNTLRADEYALSNAQVQLQGSINHMEKELHDSKRKQFDLSELAENYQKNLEYRRAKTRIVDKLSKLRVDLKHIKEEIKNLDDYNTDALDSRRDYSSKLSKIMDKFQEYSMYAKKELIQKDIEDVEARYKALSNEITSELKDIEEALKRAKDRFVEQEKDLTRTSKKLMLKEEEYIDEIYDSFIYETIEGDISQQQNELNNEDKNKNSLDTKIAVKEKEITQKFDKLYENLGEKEILPRSQIIFTEFKKRIEEKQDELSKINYSLKLVNAKLLNYTTNISGLAEFTDLLVVEPMNLEKEVNSLDNDGLDRFRGMLLRDFRQINESKNKLSAELSTALDTVARHKSLQDDFFRRPLNTLFSLVSVPFEFIEQLMTTIRAYEDLMAKLEIDIAIIDKEKERVIEMLLEYIGEIHKNIGKIDKNSSIKIRDKSIKMLRINLQEWDDEVYSYRNRLKEMIEVLTQSGINRLENNENIEELIGTLISTKNLYNTVVGINNIEIKLYKIEAEREYPIKWAEVAKNSGGEGFLSAFVVLSSLLSFMRRDETDIFSELEEGKVLVMDNPFAQTNSSHLLRPLMDVAKKSNTQLICFTGLGGESIYNCFDNIYVLNLISSKLRKGMQYLKSEHTKGEEFEAMTTSQVRTEDVEQLGFLF